MAQSRRSMRQARWVLLWALGVFVLLQVLGSVLLDYYWLSARFPAAATLFASVRHNPQPVDVLAMGSSRFGAVYADEIGRLLQQQQGATGPVRAVTASIPAGDGITADFLLKHFLRDGVRPAVVLVEVSPESLNHCNTWLEYHVVRQLTWRETPAFLVDVLRTGQAMRWFRSRFLPFELHRQQICRQSFEGLCRLAHTAFLGVEGADPSPTRGEGARSSTMTGREVDRDPSAPGATAARGVAPPPRWEELLRLKPRKASDELMEIFNQGRRLPRELLRDYRIGGNTCQALERVIRRCRQYDIEVILVGVPVTSIHREFYTPQIERDFLAHMEYLTRTYHCRFIDYRDQVPDCLFRDIHHLDCDGGTYFSRRLARDLLSTEWWRKRIESLALQQ